MKTSKTNRAVPFLAVVTAAIFLTGCNYETLSCIQDGISSNTITKTKSQTNYIINRGIVMDGTPTASHGIVMDGPPTASHGIVMDGTPTASLWMVLQLHHSVSRSAHA